MLETTLTGNPVQVRDLDPEWLLDLAAEAEVQARIADRKKLRLAAQWCVLHPATLETGFVTWSETGLPGLCPADEALGGQGTPLVAAFSPEPFATALGVSTLSGMQLLADALNLVHRLPRVWAQVEALAVPGWKARKLAQATSQLSKAGAAYVDRVLADRIGSCGWPTIETAVAQAIATCDPHLVEPKERAGKRAWGVRLQHRGVGTGDHTWAGTSHLDVTGDTLDLTKFYDLVCDHAAQLRTLGDTDDLDVRKAKAVGVIADRQATLDLTTQRSAAKTKLYVHLSLADLLGLDDGAGFGTVEKFGPATTSLIRDWVHKSRVTIQPVLDMARVDGIVAHDPPAWMRELVVLRDRHCAFPWCQRDARACDLDHITRYDDTGPPGSGGPPGQTRPDNLAPLCRRHHRAKTIRRWRYTRNPSGGYQWTGPHHQTYLVTPHGTITIAPN